MEMEMESSSGGDDWLARDKFYHVIFCFSINLFFSLLASHSRYPFLRRRSICFGSLFSLAAGTAKELADQFGFFYSAGASSRDAVADLVGVLLAVLVLSLSNSISTRSLRPLKSGQPEGGIEMV